MRPSVPTCARAGHAPRRLLPARGGVAAVEFALCIPILLAVLLSLFDACLALRQTLRVVNADAAAANYVISAGGSLDGTRLAAIAADLAAIVRGSADGLSAAEVTVRFNNAADGSAIDTYFCVSGSPPHWSATGRAPAACGDGTMSGKFVTIATSLTYRPLIPTSAAFTGFAAIPDTVTARLP